MPTDHTAQPRAASPLQPQTLRLWNGRLKVPRGFVTDLVFIRISATGDFEKYENQHLTAEKIFSYLPDAPHLEALPREVRMPGVENDALRAEHGVVPLYFSDLPNAGRKKNFLGYAFLGGSTLWFFIMNSASEGNLPPWPGDPTKEERNAFTELVVTTAVILYEAGSRELALRFAQWSRMERLERFGSRMRTTVKDRPGMSLWEGDRRVDLHDSAAQVINSVNSGLTNAEYTTLKTALYNGNLNHLAENKWEKPENFLPFGYHFLRDKMSETFTRIHKGVVAADESHRAALKELVEMAAAGDTWTDVGRRAAALGVPQRSLEGRGKTFADLQDYALARAAQGLIGNPNYINLWRTGSMTVRRVAPIKGANNIRGRELSFEEGAPRGHVDTVVTWPLPEGGWGVSEETWERLLARLERERDQRASHKNASGIAASQKSRRAFSGAPSWFEGGYEYRLIPDSPSAYRLRRRAAEEGRDSQGRPRGWLSSEGVALGTFHGVTLHTSVSHALEEALLRLVASDTTIGAIRVTDVAGERLHEERERRRVEFEAEAAHHIETAAALDELAVRAQIAGQSTEVEHYTEKAAAERARARELSHLVTALSSEVEDGRQTEQAPVALDLSNPLVVAVALRRYEQQVPAVLVDALVTLGITSSLRITLNDDASMGCWSATCQVPVVGEEATASITISGVVANSAPPTGAPAGARRDFKETIARLFFVEQNDLETIAASFNRDVLWTSRRLKEWLRSHGVTANGLAQAALQCPLPETRRAIYAACTQDASVVVELAPTFVEHIATTYLGDHGMTSWVPGVMRPQRQLLSALVTTPDGAAVKHDLAESLGLSPRQVADVARGWSRRIPIVERTNYVTLRLKRCPHPDCSGHPGYLAQYLITPETPNGLICTSCRRCPENADVVYPAGYLQPWEGPDVHLGEVPTPRDVATVDLLTAAQVAERLHCSVSHVRARLEPTRRVGSTSLYHPADVAALGRSLKCRTGR